MRLFLAILPPPEIKDNFKNIQIHLKQFDMYLRFVDPRLIHLTVRFLGNSVSEKSVTKILPMLQKTLGQLPRFNIKIKEPKYGFGEKWPKVLFASIEKCVILDRLLKEVNDCFEGYNLPDIHETEHEKSSILHFTLARTKKRLTKDIVTQIHRKLGTIQHSEAFKVKDIALMKSELFKLGPKYKILETFSLKS